MAEITENPFNATQIKKPGQEKNTHGRQDAGGNFPGSQADEGPVKQEKSGRHQCNIQGGTPSEHCGADF
ncbi:MAG: hypothetical protein QNI88_16870 [Desulfobacterales bacterium]|nr:hypothetical protein [Desulfobacterales bacterium]